LVVVPTPQCTDLDCSSAPREPEPGPANDYFADGLTDEIIRNLSIIDGLAVRSQTSSFVFKGQPRNVREAGKQLQADYIVEGSVLRAGTKLRINAQLISVRDDFHCGRENTIAR
jgi:adenylate cyclase